MQMENTAGQSVESEEDDDTPINVAPIISARTNSSRFDNPLNYENKTEKLADLEINEMNSFEDIPEDEGRTPKIDTKYTINSYRSA